MGIRNVSVALSMSVREYARKPVLLGILTVIPVYFIGVFGVVLSDTAVRIDVADGTTVETTVADVIGVFVTPLTGAIVGGVLGLFIIQNVTDNDERLLLAGYRPVELILARFGLLWTGGVLVTVVSLVVLGSFFVPQRPLVAACVVLIGTLIYGAIGMLVGTRLETLPGVYTMLGVPMVDIVLFQNPLTTDVPEFSAYLPGHFVVTAAVDASFGSGFDVSNIYWSIAYLAVLLALSGLLFYRKDA